MRSCFNYTKKPSVTPNVFEIKNTSSNNLNPITLS